MTEGLPRSKRRGNKERQYCFLPSPVLVRILIFLYNFRLKHIPSLLEITHNVRIHNLRSVYGDVCDFFKAYGGFHFERNYHEDLDDHCSA